MTQYYVHPNPIINEAEKEIALILRRYMSQVITWNRVYTEKRVFQNVIRVKFDNWRSASASSNVESHCYYTIRKITNENIAFFLKPVLERRVRVSYGREYMIPCIMFYFNI